MRNLDRYGFAGELIGPDHTSYDAARRVFNGMIEGFDLDKLRTRQAKALKAHGLTPAA